ncbi:MAG: LysM peptidoglycan-binding domain-containing protein [Planctomycetes bacterium]|nr:LysM peptidoglycan-binding domain-containing protein [Planctomycetota bacterium]
MRAFSAMVLVGVAWMLVVGCGPKKEELPALEPADAPAAKAAKPGAPPAAPPKAPVVVEPSPPPPVARPKAPVERPAFERPPADKPAPEPAPPAVPQTYTIKAGDTLYTLAKRFYGDGKLWTRIADANKDKIKDVSHIPIGTVLAIPPK